MKNFQMKENLMGKLEKIDGTLVFIDGNCFDGSKIQKFLPKSVNIDVEYAHNNENILSFVKALGKTEKPSYTSFNSSKSKGAYKAESKGRESSIIKQVIFKEACSFIRDFKMTDYEDITNSTYELFEMLLVKFEDILKNKGE